jgi:hypothetical protein
MQNSKRNEFWYMNDVPNSTDFKKTLINVDSRFKENVYDTPSDFYYRTAYPLKNIVRIKLVAGEIPNVWYAFSSLRNNTSFHIKMVTSGEEYLILIDDGNYTLGSTSTNLLDAIQYELDKINTIEGCDLKIQLDPVRTQIVIFDDSATPQEFILDFSQIRANRVNDWGLGYSLGFRFRKYGEGSRYLAEAPPDTHIDTYILIQVNDYESFQQNSGSIGIFAFGKIVIKEDKYNIIFADDDGTLYTREFIFPKPTNIPRFHIRILDMYGEKLDMRFINTALTFEVTEVTNANLYKQYLSYNP